MKRAGFGLLSLLLAACGHHGDDGVRFTYRAPAVGQPIAEDDTQTSKLTLTTSKATSQLEQTEHEVTRSQVLAIDGDAITGLRVTYDTKETHSTIDGKPDDETSPLAGHTYDLSVTGGTLTITRSDGVAVGDDERSALSDAHADLGKLPPLARVLAARTWKLGETVALTVDDLSALGRGDADNHPVSGSLTLQQVDGDLATFQTEVTVERNDERAHVQSHLAGTVEVNRGARPVEITTTGTATGAMVNQIDAPTVDGSTVGHTTFTY